MKRTITTLSCALLLMGAARAQATDVPRFASATQPTTTGSDADHVGENTGYVGDFDESEFYQSSGSYVGDTEIATDNVGTPIDSDFVPHATAPSHGMPMGRSLARGYGNSSGCDTGFGSFAGTTSSCDDHWLRAETLLWFTQDRETPPLVTTGPTLANQQNQFGNPIDSGLAPGYRLDYGHYFADGRVGLGARVWGLYGENEDFAVATDDPSRFILRPFMDTNDSPLADGPLIVAGTFPGATFVGNFNAESQLDMIATEAYGRLLFGRSRDYRVDLIGGYTYFGIDDDLSINSTSLGGGGPLLDRRFSDSFEAENRFYGGQLGFETMLNKGRWSLTSLTKVHLGSMNQRVRISGSSTQTFLPNPPGPTVTTNRGFFADENQGVEERNEFAFVPEANVKLGYAIRENVNLTVGYTFMYWSSVALAGNQVDPNVDGLDLVSFTDVVPTGFAIQEDGFWVQGIDLGMNITF